METEALSPGDYNNNVFVFALSPAVTCTSTITCMQTLSFCQSTWPLTCCKRTHTCCTSRCCSYCNRVNQSSGSAITVWCCDTTKRCLHHRMLAKTRFGTSDTSLRQSLQQAHGWCRPSRPDEGGLGRAGRKWWKYLFWGILNVGIISAYILWMTANRPLPANIRLFSLKSFKLIHDLCDGYDARVQRKPAVTDFRCLHVFRFSLYKDYNLYQFSL